MKKIILMLGLLCWLGAGSALGAEGVTNTTAALVAADSEAAFMQAAMLQLRDIEQRKTAAVATIPGVRPLDAQIADLSTRLRAAEEARRLLITSNRTVVAVFEQEAEQVRATLQRREDPQVAALLQQKMAQLQSQTVTNQVTAPVALPDSPK